MATREVEIITGIETPTQPAEQDPQNPGDLITKGFADKNYQQGTAKKESIADVKAIPTSDRKDGDKVWVQQIEQEYYFDDSSVATGDDDFVLVPDVGTGRWLLDSIRNKQITLTDTTNSTSTTTGAVVTPGGVGIAQDLTVGGVIRGTGSATINDLTTTGTTTFANSTEVEITDAKVTYNKNGTQATADLNEAGFEVDMTDATNAGIGYNSSLASKFNVGEDGSRSEIVDAGSDQEMTGLKRFDREIELEAVTTPAGNPTTGLKLYAKSDDKLYIKNSAGGETEVGTGGGGSGSIVGLTQFLAEDFNTSIAAALAYDDGASATPTDGTGAGGAGLTATLETTTPINGGGSLKVAKDAANRQGQGKRFDFTVVDSFTNTLLPMRFLWRTDSGYVDGDSAVFIYDVDNAQLLNGGEAYISLNQQTADGPIDFSWASTDSNNYRLLIHQVSTSTAASAYFLDDLVSESVATKQGAVVDGTIIADVDNTNFTNDAGVTCTGDLMLKRVGSDLVINGRLGFSGTGTDTSPLIMDLSEFLPDKATPVADFYGGCNFRQDNPTTTSQRPIYGWLRSTGNDRQFEFATNSSSSLDGDNFGSSGTLFDSLSIAVVVPIEEWQGSGTLHQLNNSAIHLNARFRAESSNNQNVASGANFLFETVNFDSASAYSTSTGEYTIPVDGFYHIHSKVRFDSPASQAFDLEIHKNGAVVSKVFDNARSDTNAASQIVSDDLKLVKGDTISIVPSYAGAVQDSEGGVIYNNFTIFRWADFTSNDAVGFGIADPDNYGLVREPKLLTIQQSTGTAEGSYVDVGGGTLTLDTGDWMLEYGVTTRVTYSGTLSTDYSAQLAVALHDSVDAFVGAGATSAASRSSATSNRLRGSVNQVDRVNFTSETTINLVARVSLENVTDTDISFFNGWVKATKLKD